MGERWCVGAGWGAGKVTIMRVYGGVDAGGCFLWDLLYLRVTLRPNLGNL